VAVPADDRRPVRQGLALADAVRRYEDVLGAEVRPAPVALRRELLRARPKAAQAPSVSLQRRLLIYEVERQVLALGDAVLATADLLALFEDDAMLLTEGAAAVNALRRGIFTATRKEALDRALLVCLQGHEC